jgi:hypothetical protein
MDTTPVYRHLSVGLGQSQLNGSVSNSPAKSSRFFLIRFQKG